MNCKLLSLIEISQLVGLSRSTIWRLRAQGDFPAGVRLTSHSTRWYLHEIQAWLEDKRSKV